MSKRKLEPTSTNGEVDVPPAKRQRTNGVKESLPFLVEFFGASDKGKKAHLEDRRLAIADLSSASDHPFFQINQCRLFCIIDGHGGSTVSSYCQDHLASVFVNCLKQHLFESSNPGEKTNDKVHRALHATFKVLDERILRILAPMKSEGATCTLVYIHNGMVFTANIGDSKAVLARITEETASEKDWDEHTLQPLIITKDHTALQLSEVRRIEARNGHVVNGRVNGILEVTRSFGDPELKKVGVSATPHVSKFKVCNRDMFMMIACDGLWSVFSPSDAADFVYEKFNHTSAPSVEDITRQLLADAMLNKQAKDNVSAIIIRFKHA